jgi:hypothetical protein
MEDNNVELMMFTLQLESKSISCLLLKMILMLLPMLHYSREGIDGERICPMCMYKPLNHY